MRRQPGIHCRIDGHNVAHCRFGRLAWLAAAKMRQRCVFLNKVGSHLVIWVHQVGTDWHASSRWVKTHHSILFASYVDVVHLQVLLRIKMILNVCVWRVSACHFRVVSIRMTHKQLLLIIIKISILILTRVRMHRLRFTIALGLSRWA